LAVDPDIIHEWSDAEEEWANNRSSFGGVVFRKSRLIPPDRVLSVGGGTFSATLFKTESPSMEKPFAIIASSGVQYFDTLDKALTRATDLSHQGQADVYVFKAVKKVSPKRDVVVTEIA
jgi:hypothetical protein